MSWNTFWKGVGTVALFDDIVQGLEEAIAHEKGALRGAAVHRVSVDEVRTCSPEEIRAVRRSANMTQVVFAACNGVTPKAVEAWEGGRSKPDGAARRTIGLLQKNPRFADEAGIITR